MQLPRKICSVTEQLIKLSFAKFIILWNLLIMKSLLKKSPLVWPIIELLDISKSAIDDLFYYDGEMALDIFCFAVLFYPLAFVVAPWASYTSYTSWEHSLFFPLSEGML